MTFVDLLSLELHKAVVEKMRGDEGTVIRRAKANVARWLRNENFRGEAGAPLREWQSILESNTPDEIGRLLISQTDDAQRLRSSSPFTGILTRKERDAILQKCAEIEPV